jgi:hypothetical protein
MTKRAGERGVTDAVFVLIPAALAITYWVVTFGA